MSLLPVLPMRFDRSRITWVLAILMAAAIVAAYANSLQLGFTLDDGHVVAENPHIRRLANIPRFFVDPNLFSVNHQSKLLRPILTTTYALNYAISGLDTWSYHVVNILLHWLAVLLIFRIVRDHLWLGNDAVFVAVAAALVVAVHPLNSEPVNYISSRSALLATVFYLGAFDAAIRKRRRLCCLLFVLALLTKTIAVTLPLVVLGYHLLARRRSHGGPAEPTPWRFVGLLLLLDCAAGIYRFVLLPAHVAGAMGEAGVTPWQYFMTQWSAYLYYLRLFAWPNALVIDRKDFPIVDSFWAPQAWLSLGVLLCLCGAAWRMRRRWPAVSFAAFWYVVTLAPESSFFPLAEPVNEHRPYLAMLGIGTAFGVGIWRLVRLVAGYYNAPPAWALAVCLTFVTSVLGSATVGRNQTWQSAYTLWVDATEKAPKNPRAWLNAGNAALARSDHAEARRFLMKARSLAPCYAYVYINLSVLEARLGDPEASLRWANDAVRCGPLLPISHHYRGQALERIGRVDKALAAYRLAAAIDDHYVDAWFRQALLLEQRQAWPEAEAAYERVLALDPTHATAAMNAGLIQHYRLGNPATAVRYYRKVLALVPSHYGAHYQIALAHYANGNSTEAFLAWELFVPLAEAIGDTAAIHRGAIALTGGTA